MVQIRKRKYKAGETVQEIGYDRTHAERLIPLMEKGRFNTQIMADFGICQGTFYNWLKQHEDFKKAYDLGRPRRFSVWLEKAEKAINEGSDKGVKFWTVIMNNMFQEEGWISEYSKGTQINIHNNTLNVQQTPQELLENVKANFTKLFDHQQKELLQIPEIKEIIEIKKES